MVSVVPCAFRAALGEIVAAFAKIHRILAEMRAATPAGGGRSDFCKDVEAFVLAARDAEAALARNVEGLRAAQVQPTASKSVDCGQRNYILPLHNALHA